MSHFVLSLGANLGDPVAVLRDAVARLAATPKLRVTGVSSLYRTAPVGGVEQPDFRNLVIVGETELSASALLAVAQGIERAHGRTREVRWGPRTLDIDVIDVDGVHSDDPVLTLPHPRAHERAFVLVPWLEVEPGAFLGERGPVRTLLERLDDRGVVRELDAEQEWWS